MSPAPKVLLLINRQARRGQENVLSITRCLQELGFDLIVESSVGVYWVGSSFRVVRTLIALSLTTIAVRLIQVGVVMSQMNCLGLSALAVGITDSRRI